jgi:hypothetical protein
MVDMICETCEPEGRTKKPWGTTPPRQVLANAVPYLGSSKIQRHPESRERRYAGVEPRAAPTANSDNLTDSSDSTARPREPGGGNLFTPLWHTIFLRNGNHCRRCFVRY